MDTAPDLELINTRNLVWQLRNNANAIPLTHVWCSALMLEAARRMETMHADYVSNGPVADDERRTS